MPLRILCITLLCISGCASGANAVERDTEQLLVEIPDGWLKVIDRKVGDLHIAEYYPAETATRDDIEWQQKLSIEALAGNDLPDPIVFAEGLADEQRSVCNEFSDNGVFAGFENGYPAVVHMMQCGQSKRTGKALLTMLKVIQGNKALYTITRIWRLEPAVALVPESAPPIPVDQAELGAWSQTLRQVKVCDAALPAHPC